MEKRVLTTGEIAKYCGVNFRTVIRWIKRGHLRAYQLPGRGDNRIEVDDFIHFLREHRMPIPEDLHGAAQAQAKRVLIVEDDVSMARTIQRILHRGGFETMITSDGFHAGVLVESFDPVVMTLDLNMPGLGGFDVIRFVKSRSVLKNMKILVISAMAPKDLEVARETGADDVLEKPFDNEILLEKVIQLAEVQ